MKQKDGIVYTELKRFGDLISAKGVGRAMKSETLYLKAMWILAVIVLFVITIYNVCNLTIEYMKYNTGTKITEKKVDIVQDKSSDILLCNINPYSSVFLNETIEKSNGYRKLITEWTSTSHTEQQQQQKQQKFTREELRSLNSIRQELLTGHSGFFQHIGLEEASRLSHIWKNFVINCQVYFLDGVMEKSIPCADGNIRVERFRHKDYFNCFKIFGRGNKSSRPTTGMSFLLYIDDIKENLNSNGFTTKTNGKGAVLTKVESGTFLNPNTRGVEILPGYVTTIKFEPVHRKRLPKPYGDCTDRRNQQNHGVNNNDDSSCKVYRLPYLYTEEACLSTCIECKIIQTCGCQDVGQYGILLDVFRNVSMCGATNQGKDVLLERMKCAQKWRSTFRNKCLGKCSPPCTEIIDDKKVTYLEISLEQIREKLREEKQRSSVPNLYKEKQILTPDYDDMELNTSNFAWVYLKRGSTSYFLVEDTESMTISDWLAKVGGATNLWSGITVFVFVEIVDFLCRLVRGMFSSEIPNDRKEHSDASRCHCDCHCSCNTKHKDSNQAQQEDRYTGTYGNVNSGFY